MKMTNKVVLLVSIFLASACASSGGTSDSGSDLETALRGNSFTVEGLDDVIDDCSSGSSTDAGNSTTGVDEEEPTTNLASRTDPVTTSSGGSAADETEQIVSFSTTTFNYLVDGTTELSGSWEAEDDNTIVVTIDGEEISIDIEVDGDTITVTDSDCSDGGSGTDGAIDGVSSVAACEESCLEQGGTDDVCSDGCDGDDTTDCTDEIEDDCFELCIASDNDAFDCAENECAISCPLTAS